MLHVAFRAFAAGFMHLSDVTKLHCLNQSTRAPNPLLDYCFAF